MLELTYDLGVGENVPSAAHRDSPVSHTLSGLSV